MTTLDLHVSWGGENPELIKQLKEPVVDPNKFPIISRALESQRPANTLCIEWLTDHGIERNWQQIFRQPFAYRFASDGNFGEEADKALDRLLVSLEATALYGTPGRTPWASTMPCSFMGGVRHYLGRDLRESDEVALRPLRSPILLLMRGEYDLYNDHTHHGEWLCETSLEIRAKEAA